MAKLLNDKTFWKNTLRIAVPVAIQNLLFSSFTLVDTIFVSRLGDVSLSAVGIAFLFRSTGELWTERVSIKRLVLLFLLRLF